MILPPNKILIPFPYEKIRRFVIISPMKGHCLCLPLNTYLKQGTLKSGVYAEHHTIVYTGKKPEYLPGEWDKGMRKPPIRIDANSPRDKLDPQTRLNYAKVYTVEYNVLVCFIGRVSVDSRSQMVADYNVQHPQLSHGISLQPADPDTVSYAGQQWPEQNAYPTAAYGMYETSAEFGFHAAGQQSEPTESTHTKGSRGTDEEEGEGELDLYSAT